MVVFLCDLCGVETRRVNNKNAQFVIRDLIKDGDGESDVVCDACSSKKNDFDKWCEDLKYEVWVQFNRSVAKKREEVFRKNTRGGV